MYRNLNEVDGEIAMESPIIVNRENHKTEEVKHAIILAAGKGERFKEKGIELPKVLLKVGGLRLLERAILGLSQVGIQHFYIVVGAYREQVVAVMSKIERLKKLDIQYITCEDYALGNGVSFGKGAEQVNASFLLSMSDHIFSIDTIRRFVTDVTKHPKLPALACDPNLEEVFDMDDATKVASNNNKIVKIGKELEHFDLVDMGLFYFPKGYGKLVAEKVSKGATSVSTIIQEFIEEKGIRTTILEESTWQDVDNPGMRKEANQRLRKTLTKTTDGWVSKNINRFFSTRISLFLARFNTSPNLVTTFVFFFTLWGAWLVASGEYLKIVAGAIIFQIASILDGCDGELSRLLYKSSKFGAWYDTITDNIRYIAYFVALGIAAYTNTGSDFYYYATIIVGVLASYSALIMARFVWHNGGPLTNLEVTKKVDKTVNNNGGFFNQLIKRVRGIEKQDVSAFLLFILCIIGLYKVMFWIAFVGVIIAAITITKSVSKA